ncbi:SDR family NAD(P)-dependent oxidoreductase [Larkinella rosea]|uniref:SDR family NAD(P)-dependent oxidoreductase n=1 Tax=Larkinella rosea TaxID=2025312 RepID=A0A3P1BJ03_9BACT|nr:SDR family NAD(P)-dependent oxidoreductase [Larkinella rosea]RRB00975.1 SDR family NAD(P)-dependent oxidoreductase [Larkinella rosea]
MNILLTGGAGFIGSNLAKQLLEEGHRVICLDNLDGYYDPDIKWRNVQQSLNELNYHFHEGDIRDAELIDMLFRLYSIDAVVHLAARAGVRPSVQDPALYYDVNVTGTLTVLQAMQRWNVKKMVFASSSSVYGDSPNVPFAETDTADRPLSPYAASKRAAELLCHTFHHLYGFDIFCLRFFTVYGPQQRPEMAISQFTDSILKGRPINVFGDGSTARDYTYVEDIVSGIIQSLDNLKGYEVLNIGGSDPISLANLIKLIEQSIGEQARINRLPMQAGDVQQTYADITKASQLIGYQPAIQIEEGVRRFVEWYRSQLDVCLATH